MSVITNKLNDLLPTTYRIASDNSLPLRKNTFFTVQGLKFTNHNLFSNIQDLKSKNYSVNILTDTKKFTDITTISDINNELDFITTLQFNGFQQSSDIKYLTYNKTGTEQDSTLFFDKFNNKNQYFILDFFIESDTEKCKVKINDQGLTKYLNVNENLSLTFNTAGTNFEYSIFDNILNLFYKANNENYIIGTANGILSAVKSSDADFDFIKSSYIKTIYKNFNVDFDINSFVLYDNDKEKSNESITDQKNNYLSYFLNSTTQLSGDKFVNDLDFFNLKNNLSNKNNINTFLPFSNKTQQRVYTNILNKENKEFENENLTFNYNFYTKEYKLMRDKLTKIVTPDTLYPFKQINVNDTNLVNGGSYASTSPYYSDKIFKLLDSDENFNFSIPNTLGFDFILQNGNNLKTQNDLFFVLQSSERVSDVENNGTYLTTWLSSNGDTGIWFDRYVLPNEFNFLEATQGITPLEFNSETQARKFFKENSITDNIFDIKSKLTFTPKTTYYYQRIGSNYINNTIEKNNSFIIKQTFDSNSVQSTQLTNQSILNISQGFYDSINLNTLDEFCIYFNYNIDNKNINTYQLIGNLFETGISLKNNFYFTPFIFVPNGNELNLFDKDFNLVNQFTFFDINYIKDVLFIDQQNFVIYGNNTFIKTNYTGEIIEKNILDFEFNYDDRFIHSNNIVDFILKDNNSLSSYKLDLNNLYFSNTNSISSNVTLSGNNLSLIYKDKPIVIKGSNGCKVNENLFISLSTNSIIEFDNFDFDANIRPLSSQNVLYDLISYNNNIYIQSFNNNRGKILVFNTYRKLISSFDIPSSCLSGLKLDIIDENGSKNLISISKRDNNFITFQKINLENSLISTFNTQISSVNIGPISKNIFNENNKYEFLNCTGFEFMNEKYSNLNSDLYLTTILKNLYNPKLTAVNVGDDFVFDSSQKILKNYFDPTNINKDNLSLEKIVPINLNVDNNYFVLNVSLTRGIIQLFVNGKFIDETSFNPNRFSIQEFKNNTFYFNNINGVSNDNIVDLLNDTFYLTNKGNISDLRVYNKFLDRELIEYLFIKNIEINNIIFDIPSGTRNNIEEIYNLYNYKIPGMKNNNLRINIRNGGFDNSTRSKIISFLDSEIRNYLPINTESIEYSFEDS